MKITDQVAHCLKEYPETRNSDTALTIKIWEVFYSNYMEILVRTGEKMVRVQDLYELPREDTVKRLRALFNAQNLWLPTDWKVAKQRRINEGLWRDEMAYLKINDQLPNTANSV